MWDVRKHDWVVATGIFHVYVGASSRDVRLSDSFVQTDQKLMRNVSQGVLMMNTHKLSTIEMLKCAGHHNGLIKEELVLQIIKAVHVLICMFR